MAANSGRLPRNLSESIIRDAMRHTKSNMQAARYLNITLDTYKKYARMYVDQATGKTLYELHDNRAGKGIPKLNWKKEIASEKLDQVLTVGDYKPVNAQKFKERLLYEGKLKLECYRCGHNEKRVIDYKQPLILNHLDGNKHNWRLDNLEMICYNCHFLYMGGMITDKQLKSLEAVVSPLVEVQPINHQIDDGFLDFFQDLQSKISDNHRPGDEFISRL